MTSGSASRPAYRAGDRLILAEGEERVEENKVEEGTAKKKNQKFNLYIKRKKKSSARFRKNAVMLCDIQ